MILQRNILFFIYRLYGGGAERVVSNLSMALGDNYNIKIIIYDLEEKTYPYKGELIRIKLPFSKIQFIITVYKELFAFLCLLRNCVS
jgi:hypothetical protein